MSNTKEQSYSIGQVVYILSDKAESIVPAIVVEEVVVKKLDGNTVSWKVAVGPPQKEKIVASDEISGTVYTSLDEIKTVMNKRLSDFINNLVGEAEKRTNLWYGDRMKPPSPSNNMGNGKSEKIDPSSLISNIENDKPIPKNEGRSPKLGSTPAPDLISNNPNDKEFLREKLRRLATPDESEQVQESAEYVVTDDGRQIPVKYNENQQ